jgi:methylphosphotriester-DNA--protein-cysteine methyltransferase
LLYGLVYKSLKVGNAVSDALIGLAVQTAIFLLGGFAMVIRTEVGARQLKEEVASMKEGLKKLTDVIIIQAVQTTRLDNMMQMVTSMERRIEDLRRGMGYVERRDGTKEIDREY